jgi:hypothetical protein
VAGREHAREGGVFILLGPARQLAQLLVARLCAGAAACPEYSPLGLRKTAENEDGFLGNGAAEE